MHTRALAQYSSMKRIAVLIERHAALRALAAESKAFDHFKSVIVDFDALLEEEPRNYLEARALEAKLAAAKHDLHDALECIAASAALIPLHVLVLPALRAPSPRLTTCHFESVAASIVRLVEPHLDVFVEHGLHPRKLDDIRRLAAEVTEIDLRLRWVEVGIDTFRARLDATRERGRKRAKQLYYELKPVLDAGARAEWRSAASLGRTHRPRGLAGSPQLRALPAGEASEPVGDATRARPGLSGLARSVMLRIAGGDDRPGDDAAPPDVKVEPVARLKSSNG